MQYIVFDCEFNQDIPSIQGTKERSSFPFEIIQIGAVKLDINYHTLSQFNRFIKPTIYAEIAPFITELTGITTLQLQNEEQFPAVYEAFKDFIGGRDNIFCIWGMSDIKEIYRNASFHQLDYKQLPNRYINIQPFASIALDSLKMDQSNCSSAKLAPMYPTHLGRLLRLQYVVEALSIPMTVPFHDALSDAYYTSEIFKRIDHSILMPYIYDPTFTVARARQPKRVVDFEKLFAQFQKMYTREMTSEEKEIIRLSYQMGKTGQFIK